jgi:hypothetical protein
MDGSFLALLDHDERVAEPPQLLGRLVKTCLYSQSLAVCGRLLLDLRSYVLLEFSNSTYRVERQPDEDWSRQRDDISDCLALNAAMVALDGRVVAGTGVVDALTCSSPIVQRTFPSTPPLALLLP